MRKGTTPKEFEAVLAKFNAVGLKDRQVGQPFDFVLSSTGLRSKTESLLDSVPFSLVGDLGLTTTRDVKSVTKLYFRAISVAFSSLSSSVIFLLSAFSSRSFSMVKNAHSFSMKLGGLCGAGGKG